MIIQINQKKYKGVPDCCLILLRYFMLLESSLVVVASVPDLIYHDIQWLVGDNVNQLEQM